MNKIKSRVRCRVEHVFGAMKSRCRDEVLRTIGIGRAKFWIGMKNLTYNYGQIFEFEASEKGAEIGVIALEVRAGGGVLAFSGGILGDFGLKSGESAEILPKMLDFRSASG